MKNLREDENAYAAFVESDQYIPYLRKVIEGVNESMNRPVRSILPFVPGIFVLAGYAKLDKNYYPVLRDFMNTCIKRCVALNDAHRTEHELWTLMRFIRQLEDLHFEVDGVSMDMDLGSMVMEVLVRYLWGDYCADKEKEQRAE